MRLIETFSVALCLLALLGLATPASASVAVRLPLPDLVKGSSLVVRGKVTQQQSFKDADTGRIMTRHTLVVAEVWKGSVTKSVEILTLGGELEEIGQWVPGEAVLKADQDVVVFLQPTQGGYVVTAMAQGLFRVERRAEGEVLVRDLSGVQFVGEGVPMVRATSGVLEVLGLKQLQDLCKQSGK